MRRLVIAAFFLFAAGPAAAGGFEQRDFREISIDVEGFEGGAYISSSMRADRATIFCETCQDIVAIDFLLLQSPALLEERLRTDENALDEIVLECRVLDPTCEIGPASSGAAVGFMTAWRRGNLQGVTIVLVLGEDQLTIRSIAGDLTVARSNAERALEIVGPQIVGGG